MAPARTRLIDADGSTAGMLTVSVISAQDYARLVKRLTDTEVVITAGEDRIFSTLPGPGSGRLPASGEVEIAGDTRRLAGFEGVGFSGGRVSVRVLVRGRGRRADQGGDRGARDPPRRADRRLRVRDHRLAPLQSRSSASDGGEDRWPRGLRRRGPDRRSDEFARSASSSTRCRASSSGGSRSSSSSASACARRSTARPSSGKTLERGALLEIALQTAVDGVEAARWPRHPAQRRPRALEQRAGEGDVAGYRTPSPQPRLRRSARGPPLGPRGDAFALSFPMREQDNRRVLGMLSVARMAGGSARMSGRCSASWPARHGVRLRTSTSTSRVQRQAVTDELTGLFNHRRFQEVMDSEVERAKRCNQPLGLMMLDIDNFKSVNDTYGHQQGDMVLREVARVLRESSREIDEPARYGGEELAVALPRTDLEGAFLFAERVRRRSRRSRSRGSTARGRCG